MFCLYNFEVCVYFSLWMNLWNALGEDLKICVNTVLKQCISFKC